MRRCALKSSPPRAILHNAMPFRSATTHSKSLHYSQSPVHAMAEVSAEQIAQGLSQAGTTLDGTGVAFLKLSLTAKGIASFGSTLGHLQHVRVINASGNGLKSLAAPELSGCRSLVTLSLAHNRIRRLDDLSQLRHLQVGQRSKGEDHRLYHATLHTLAPHGMHPIVLRHCPCRTLTCRTMT